MTIIINSTKGINLNTNITNNKKQTQKIKKEKECGKKLALALGTLAILGAASVLIACKIKKGQAININEINFDKGLAYLKKNGEKYTGKIEHTFNNGDKLLLKSDNGIITNSIRKNQNGKEIFNKTYEHSLNIAENKFVTSYIRTQKAENVTEFFKNNNGHIIKENSNLKKAFIEKGNRENIIANFKDGKPISSLRYKMGAQEKKELLSTKTYYANGKIHEIKTADKKIVFAKEKGTFPYNSDAIEIKFEEYLGPKNIIYMKDGKPVGLKDIEFNQDYVPYIRTQGDLKYAKHITTYAFDEKNPAERVGKEIFGGKRIEEKYLYPNGTSDIVKEGYISSYKPVCDIELEHINPQGKTTGFSRVEFSKDYNSFNNGFNASISEYPCTYKEFNENHELTDIWNGSVKYKFEAS